MMHIEKLGQCPSCIANALWDVHSDQKMWDCTVKLEDREGSRSKDFPEQDLLKMTKGLLAC